MKIGIDARKIRDFGVGMYIANLLRYIPKYDQENEYVIFHYPDDIDEIPQDEMQFKCIPDTSPKYSLQELINLPIKMAAQRIDLFHAPHYTLPPIRPCKGIVTIHDVIHLRFPEYLPHPAAYYYAKGMMWAAAKSARKVITVSECSKQDLIRYLGIPAKKIDVVYNGIDVKRTECPRSGLEQIRQHFGISRKYLLHIGNFMPHKNFDTLIKAYSRLKHQQNIEHCLVLAGKNEKLREKLQTTIREERLTEDIFLTGFVEPEWAEALYANADLFVYPSLYEGFGLQVLEAMAHHIPLAISEIAALSEIAGNAAIRFDPTSVENMAEVIYQALTDQPLRDALVERGNKRVQQFSWQEMARRTVEIYQDVINAGRNSSHDKS